MSSFSLVHEAGLTSGLVQACWCPTMDLVAVVSADSQLSVHRLNWQRLWSVSLDNPITAMCWRPDGKVLAAGSPTGRIALYDVEKCELIKQGPACPQVTHSITHLCWVESLPGPPASTYSQLSMYRHTRLFSRPGAAPPPGTHLALTAQPQVLEWSAPPQVLGVLLASNDHGDLSLLAAGTFLLAHITPASHATGKQQCEAAQVEQVEEEEEEAAAASEQLQATSIMTRDLQHVLRTWASHGALHAELLHAPHVAARPQVVLQLAVLCNHLQDMLQEVSVSLSKAGQQWSAAQKELSRKLDGLKDCLAEHMGPGMQPEPGYGLEGEQEHEADILGELACMLAAGYVSPGMLSWLTGSMKEHGIRRLAQQLDAALITAFVTVLHEVCPRLEVVVFILGELRGLADPLLQAAHPLGLQVDMCRKAELEGVRCVMQCEMLKSQLTRQGSQYRALFTWLLKTVLLQENGGSAAATAAALMGPAAAITAGGPTAIAAAAGSLTYDIGEVVVLLEGGLLQDCVSPDLCDGWFDPDITPASLRSDPVIPLGHVKELMALSQAAESVTSQQQKREADVQQQSDQNNEQMSGQGDSTWPNKPLKKQIKALHEQVTQLTTSISTATSPKFSPSSQVTLLPSPADNPTTSNHPSPPHSNAMQLHWFAYTSSPPPAVTAAEAELALETLDSTREQEKLHVVTHVPYQHLSEAFPDHCEGLLYCSMRQGCSSPAGSPPAVQAQLVVLPCSVRVVEVAQYKDGQTALFVRQTDDGSAAAAMHLVLLPEPTQLNDMPHWQQHGSVLQACLASGSVHQLDTLLADPQSRCRTITGNAGHSTGGSGQHVSVSVSGGKHVMTWQSLAVSATRGVALVLPHKTLAQVYDLEEPEEEEGEEEGEGEQQDMDHDMDGQDDDD